MEPGFEHLTAPQIKRINVLLKRQLFLQKRIKAADSHGIDVSYDKAEEGALSWVIEWVRKTRKGKDNDQKEL